MPDTVLRDRYEDHARIITVTIPVQARTASGETDPSVSKLIVSLLGPPQVEVDGQPLQVDTRKATALLAYLAVEGRPQSREQLAVLLWPESDDESARSALRRTLSTLRGGLGGRWLEADRQAVHLDTAGVELDITRFRALAGAHRSHASEPCADCVDDLTQAVALVRGDLLAGFSLRDSPDFDDWQAAVAEGLCEEFAAVLDHLVQVHVDQGRHGEALLYARRRLTLDPLQESAHQMLMRLHAGRGDRAAALQQYRECVRVLNEELGVAPLAETTQLYQSIFSGQVSSSMPELLGTVPQQGSTASGDLEFAGREAELQSLLDAHAAVRSDGHLLVIEGEAGIGKTRLTHEFLARVHDRGGVTLHGSCYDGELNLAYGPVITLLRAGLTMPDASARLAGLPAHDLAEAARLVPAFADASVPPPLDSPAARARFFDGIGNVLDALVRGEQPGVVAIEDVQWADEATTDLVIYLAHRLHLRSFILLLTWRSEDLSTGHRLRGLVAERRRSHGAVHLQLGRLDQGAVRQILTSASIDPGAVEAYASRLFQETEGLPFFVVQFVADLLDGAEGADRTDAPLPTGIRELLLGRLARVSEVDAQILGTAAVIGRSFDFETLRAASARSEDETIGAIERLTHQGFFRASVERNEEPAYDFTHEKLRTLVYEETSVPRRRRLHARVAAALAGRSSRGHGEAAALIGQHFRLAGNDSAAAEYFKHAGEHARSLAANVEALAYFQAALTSGHPEVRELHQAIAELQTLAGAYHAALASYQAAAALAALTMPEQARFIEHQIAGLYLRMGAWRLAEEHCIVASAGLKGDLDVWRARVLTDQSLAVHRQGRDEEAADLAAQALQLAQSGADGLALAQAHNMSGILAAHRGDHDAALASLNDSLAAADELEDPAPGIAARNNLALVLSARGELDAATDLTVHALDLCTRRGDRHREAALRNNLADLLRTAGRIEESMEQLKSAVAIFAEIGADGGELEPEIWKLVEW